MAGHSETITGLTNVSPIRFESLTPSWLPSSVAGNAQSNLFDQEADMASKLLWAGMFVCLVVASAWSQDPTKVEPKHYKLDFENDRVQVVSVHYGPHEKSVL